MRVWSVLALCLALVACGGQQTEPPATKPIKVVPRENFAVPIAERPVLGQAGDATCASSANELLLMMDDLRCLSLLTDTVKPDSKAAEGEVKLARMRAAFFQPGPARDKATVGWILYATRTDCATRQVSVLGNVIYRPDGVEISRAIPDGGPLALPDGVTSGKLIQGVCGS